MVDFEEIKSRITIEDILLDCGYQPKKNRIPCPIHNGQNPTSFSYTDEIYYCFSCGASGGLLDLTEALLDVDRVQALKYLSEKAGQEFKDYPSNKKLKSNSVIRKKPTRVLDAKLYCLQIDLKVLDILRDHFIWRMVNARKWLRSKTIDNPRYYSIAQYAEYILEELDTEVIRTTYEINAERKRLREFRKI